MANYSKNNQREIHKGVDKIYQGMHETNEHGSKKAQEMDEVDN